MHPEELQLAAYLDGALDERVREELRAHLLTCPACSVRLERLRADARHIVAALASAGPTPDVRAAVRARLRRRPAAWLGRSTAFAGALAALVIFALMLSARSGATIGPTARLYVAAGSANQLLVLDAYDGRQLNAVAIGAYPMRVRYDERSDRLYVLFSQGVALVDPQTLTVIGRWDAGARLVPPADLALDSDHGRLYVSQPGHRVITEVDTRRLTTTRVFSVGSDPGPLVLAPNGEALFTLDGQDGAIWSVDLQRGTVATQALDNRGSGRRGWLVLSPDGSYVYVLRAGLASCLPAVPDSGRPELWRLDTHSGQVSGPFALDRCPPLWDLLALDDRHLAISRGDGRVGGVEIVDTASHTVTARIDPTYDQHQLVAGPDGSLFALNWYHGTITRYHLSTQAVVWRTSGIADPRDGVFVRTGWRWPW